MSNSHERLLSHLLGSRHFTAVKRDPGTSTPQATDNLKLNLNLPRLYRGTYKPTKSKLNPVPRALKQYGGQPWLSQGVNYLSINLNSLVTFRPEYGA